MPSSRSWPFDDDDRPSGSVRPLSQANADLQAILAHLGDDPDQLLAGTSAGRPMVAVRLRASVGRPGGSAQGRWRRMRAAEWAAWTRTLPWRIAVVLGVGAGGGVLGSLLVPRLGLVVAALASAAASWGLRFRPSAEAVAWRRGAAGERRTARLLSQLERQGWAVLHDLAVPGSQANLDHLVIGPGGVFVIDSKQYRGRLQLDRFGRLWHGRYPLVPSLQAVSFEADRAAQVLPDPGVVVLPARRLPSMLCELPAIVGPERVAVLADQARVCSTPPPNLQCPQDLAYCFASKLRSPLPIRYHRGRDLDPTRVPTPATRVPLTGGAAPFALVMPPRGGGAAAPSGCASRD
jgi:hypothetical protein